MNWAHPEEALDRGVGAINDLTGLCLPRPTRQRLSPVSPEDAPVHEVQACYDRQMEAMFGGRDLPTGGFGGLSPDILPIEPFTELVDTLRSLDEEALIRTAFDTLSIQPIGLDDAFRSGGYAYPKLNHGYWELVGRRALRRLGLEGLRDMGEFIDPASMFDEFLAVVLRARQARRGEPAGRYVSPHFSLGFSLGNGDRPMRRGLYAPPLTAVTKGAIWGALAFFKAVQPADRYQLADGGFPKGLIWDGLVDDFFRRAAEASDAIVFMGPPHLKRVRIRDSDTPTVHLMVPETSVYDQWPAVTAYVFGRLLEIAEACPRVTILAQAAAVAAPLAFLVDLVQPSAPGREMRYFDMGQALDIATLETEPAGIWLRAAQVAKAFEGRPPPIYVDPARSP